MVERSAAGASDHGVNGVQGRRRLRQLGEPGEGHGRALLEGREEHKVLEDCTLDNWPCVKPMKRKEGERVLVLGHLIGSRTFDLSVDGGAEVDPKP